MAAAGAAGTEAASGMGAGGADPAAEGSFLPFSSRAGLCLVARAAKRGGQVAAAFMAPDRAAPAAAPMRTPPAPAGERGSGAGELPNRRLPPRRRFPGSLAPRLGRNGQEGQGTQKRNGPC